jgi:hypothetical protein
VKSPLSEAIAVTLRVTSSLDALAVSYVVGGSVASSVHGIPRSTADADVIAALRFEHVVPLVEYLSETARALGVELLLERLLREA